MTSACLEGLSLDLYGPAGNSVEQTHPLGYFLPVQLFFPQKRLGMAAENDCSALTDDSRCLCVYLHPKLQPQFPHWWQVWGYDGPKRQPSTYKHLAAGMGEVRGGP